MYGLTHLNRPETVFFVKWGQPYASGRVVVTSEQDCVISLTRKVINPANTEFRARHYGYIHSLLEFILLPRESNPL